MPVDFFVTMILTLIASAQIFWEYSNLMDPPFFLNLSHAVFTGLILISFGNLLSTANPKKFNQIMQEFINNSIEKQKLTLVCRNNNIINHCLLLLWGKSFTYWIKDGSLKTKIQNVFASFSDNTFSDNFY